eukprot:COSAG01_NODE_573_length_15298_cov_13.922394_8_plen_815_part_00
MGRVPIGEVNSKIPLQSKAKRRWGLTLMFKRKDEKNLLTTDIVQKIKTRVIDKVTSAPGYSDYCLMNAPQCLLKTCSAQSQAACAAPAVGATSCSEPTRCVFSPPAVAGQAGSCAASTQGQCTQALAGGGHATHSAMCQALRCTYSETPAAAVADDTAVACAAVAGATYVPARCLPPTSPLDWAFPSEVTSPLLPGHTILRFDGQGAQISSCEPATSAGVDDLSVVHARALQGNFSLCNSNYCACVPGSNVSSPLQTRFAQSMHVMSATKWVGYMLGRSFSTSTLHSDVMQMTIEFGGPIKKKGGGQYRNHFDSEEDQDTNFEDWAVENLKDFLDNDADFDDVEVLYFFPVISFKEILNVLMHDGLLALGSIVFVFCYIYFHSASAFLAAAGMLHIVFSFPLAFCLYRFVFGIIPLYPLSFLSIYIILAIGADDIFVIVDAWRQSARAGPAVNKNLHTRLHYAYSRAAKAMAITSCTTFGAFVATATSPLGEVATFGLFTALLVAANYFFVITYYPAVLILYHRHYENHKGCCCYVAERQVPPTPEPSYPRQPIAPSATVAPASSPAPAPSSDAAAAVAGNAVMMVAANVTVPEGAKGGDQVSFGPLADGSHAMATMPEDATPGDVIKIMVTQAQAGQPPIPKEKPSRVEVFCGTKFATIVNGPAKFAMIGVLVAVMVALLIKSTDLGPTTKEDQLLPEWHKFQRIINMFNDDFGKGESTPMKLNNIVWGLDAKAPVSRDGIGRFDAESLGKLNWDRGFSLAHSQQFILSVCHDLRTAAETIDGKRVALVRQDSGLTVVNDDGSTTNKEVRVAN